MNGFGTSYVGECEHAPDGSYVTTERVIGLGVPLLPLRSFRVLPISAAGMIGVAFEERYAVQPIPLAARQVARTYGFMGAYLAWLFATVRWLYLHESLNAPPEHLSLVAVLTLVWLALPFVGAILWRNWTRRTLERQSHVDEG